MAWDTFPGLDLDQRDAARHLKTAGYAPDVLDDLDGDLYSLWTFSR